MATKTFRRHDSHKLNKLATSWRKPRGRQNKVRLNKRGYSRARSTGFGSKVAERGKVKGLIPVQVATIAALDAIDPKTQGAIIVSTLGGRKREALLKHATEKKITLLNVRDVTTALAALDKSLKQRKDEKAKRSAKKDKKKSIEEKATKPKADAEKSPEEEKKETEAAKQKILTKKQ